MADTSSSLSMPYIMPNQAQKHVTHNEALRILDVLVQLGVVADDLSAPPPLPQEGERYIVADNATADWAGHDREIAVFDTGTWQFYAPKAGWRGYVIGREALVVHDGTDWIELDSAELQDLEAFGLGMATLPGTPFSAKLNAALWTALYTADGGTGDMVQTLNKQNAAGDLGFVLQRDFQTRGLLGMFGSNDFRIATTPDGTNFRDGLVVDNATGTVSQPNLPRFKAYTNFDNFGAADTWFTIGINSADYNDQLSFDPGTSRFTAPLDGTYVFGASLVYKKDVSNLSRMAARLLVNGAQEMRGSKGEISSTHSNEITSLTIQTLAALSAGDTVELQGKMRTDPAYFLAGETCFWGYKVG